jgi:hypothetical protein
MERADRDRPAQPAPRTGTLEARNGPEAGGNLADTPAAPAPHARHAPGAQDAAGPTPPDAADAAHTEATAPDGEPTAKPSWPGRPARARWLRRAAGRPLARHAAVLVCFLAAGVAVTWPLALDLSGSLPASRDSASYVWGFWWMARQISHLSNPWFTSYMAAPVGVPLGFHTLMPLPGLLLAPVTWIFGPSASYNLMVLFVPGLLAYATYRAARLWLRSATGAVAAGACYGLSAMLTQQDWYHVNIAAGALFLPMALEASVRLRRNPGRRQAIILGLVMGAAVLTDQESSVLAAIVTGLVLLPWLLRRVSWPRLWPAAVAVGIGVLVATPQVIAMIQEIHGARGGLSIDEHKLVVSYKQYGIGLPGMFTPTPRVALFGLQLLANPFLHGRDNEGLPMFGTLLTVLAVAGIVVARKRRGTWKLAGLWAGCAAIALGTSLWIGMHQYIPLAVQWQGVPVSNVMPYTWFVRLPGLSSFREADRLAILGLLPAALLAGAAVDWLRYHARPLIAVVIALGVLEMGYSGQPKVGYIPTSYPRVDAPIAADHSNSVVVDLPFGLRGGIPVYGVPFFPQALVMATADGHPRAIAYTSRVPRPTIMAINAHPFYRYLITVQHEVPQACPWRIPAQPQSQLGCHRPFGVVPVSAIVVPRPSVQPPPSPAQLAVAARDATRMNIGWVVVWKRNISVSKFVLPYLQATGFKFWTRSGNVLVYRHMPKP